MACRGYLGVSRALHTSRFDLTVPAARCLAGRSRQEGAPNGRSPGLSAGSAAPAPAVHLGVAARFGPSVRFGSIGGRTERIRVAEVGFAAFGDWFAMVHVEPVEVGVAAGL